MVSRADSRYISFHKPSAKYQVRGWVNARLVTVGYTATFEEAVNMRAQFSVGAPNRNNGRAFKRLAAAPANPAIAALAGHLSVNPCDLMLALDALKRAGCTIVTAQGDVL